MKEALQSCPVLAQPRYNVAFLVQIDTSDVGFGAVLTQQIEGEEKVAGYDSGALRGASFTSGKECLAVDWAVEK